MAPLCLGKRIGQSAKPGRDPALYYQLFSDCAPYAVLAIEQLEFAYWRKVDSVTETEIAARRTTYDACRGVYNYSLSIISELKNAFPTVHAHATFNTLIGVNGRVPVDLRSVYTSEPRHNILPLTWRSRVVRKCC